MGRNSVLEAIEEKVLEMQDLFKSAPESPETQQAISDSLVAIDNAVAALPEEQSQSPEFVMEVIVELLKNAAAEYEAAIANARFVEVEEYQDSRGFVMYSEELYQNISEQKSQQDPEDHLIILQSLDELKSAWPSVNPPETPVKSISEVYSLVSQIQLRK
ncbi:MAG: hypothetical protein AB4368_09880 [Xenococcaceae cyanobacterium]